MRVLYVCSVVTVRFLKPEIRSEHSVCAGIIILNECETWFQGAFAKLWKATVSFLVSVHPSVHMEQLGSHWTDFHEIWYLIFFKNLSRKFKFHYYLIRITGTLHEDQYTFMMVSRSVLLRMRSVSDRSCRGNQNTRFMFSNCFLNSCLLWNIVEKLCRAGQATDNSMAHARCMLDT